MSAAKRIIRKIKGARLLRANGGLIYCDSCEKIVGSLNERGYSFINLIFICTCGNYGSIEIIKNGHINQTDKLVNKMPMMTRINLLSCTECKMPLFSMVDGRTLNYSFYTECVCGEKFDTKPTFDKRLGETLKMYKNQKEHG